MVMGTIHPSHRPRMRWIRMTILVICWLVLCAPVIGMLLNCLELPMSLHMGNYTFSYSHGDLWEVRWPVSRAAIVGPPRWHLSDGMQGRTSTTRFAEQSKDFEAWYNSIRLTHPSRSFRGLGVNFGTDPDILADEDLPIYRGIAGHLILAWYTIATPALVVCAYYLIPVIWQRRRRTQRKGFPVALTGGQAQLDENAQ